MMSKRDGIGDSFGVGVVHDNFIATVMLECWSDVKAIVCMYSP